MTEPTELLPCPFCGHAGPLDFQDGSTHRWGVAYCAECGASAGETRREYPDVGEWHAKAVAQWNTRTPQPIQAQAGAVPLPKFLALKFHARRDKKATVTLLFPGHEAADAWVRGIKGGQHGAET